MKEFKRTKPQDRLDEESIVIVQDGENGIISCVPKNPLNPLYQEFLKMEQEGYEAWWHDEEIDWEQSWEKEKAGLIAESEEESKPKKKARKKKESTGGEDA